MLQLIGWLGCVYLFVKGVDILSRVEERKSRLAMGISGATALLAIFGSAWFFVLFWLQAKSFPSIPSP